MTTTLPENNRVKAVGYCRFSSDMQREESIDAQMRYITGYAAQYNYEIVEFYCDRAKSGKNTNRPEFQRMLEDTSTGKFQAIIVHKIDRFSRNTEDTLRIIDQLKSKNITVISAYEHFENNPMGNFMLTMLSSMSEYYISNLANEVLKGQRENAYKCRANGGKGCLGYDIVNQKYVVNKEEAKSVRLIFQMYSEGYGYNSIIDRLNTLGYKTKFGKPFGKNSLYSILTNEKYTGTFLFNQIARGNSHGKRNSHRLKADSEIIRIEGGIPAIISRDVWNRVQAVRNINPKGRSQAKHFYLLSGLMYCGECGCKMHGNPRNTGNGGPLYVSYRCNHRDNNHSCNNKEVRKEYVEGFVVKELFRHFQESAVSEITKQLNMKLLEDSKSNNEEYTKYNGTLAVLKKSRSNLVDAIENTGFNRTLGNKLKDVEKQIEDCEALLRQCEEKRDNMPVFTEEQVREQLPKFNCLSEPTHREEIRLTIQKHVKRVTVFPDRVEAAFKAAFDPGSGKSVTYNCTSSVSRYSLRQYGSVKVLEGLETEKNSLCSA